MEEAAARRRRRSNCHAVIPNSSTSLCQLGRCAGAGLGCDYQWVGTWLPYRRLLSLLCRRFPNRQGVESPEHAGNAVGPQAGSRATQQTWKSAVRFTAVSPTFNHTRRDVAKAYRRESLLLGAGRHIFRGQCGEKRFNFCSLDRCAANLTTNPQCRWSHPRWLCPVASAPCLRRVKSAIRFRASARFLPAFQPHPFQSHIKNIATACRILRVRRLRAISLDHN